MQTFWTTGIITSLVLGLTIAPGSVTTPKKVTHLRAVTKTDTTITLKWKDQPTANYYQISVRKKTGQLLKKVNTTDNRKTIKGLQPATSYQFKVRDQVGKGSHKNFGHYSKIIRVRTRTAKAPILIGFWGLNGYLSADGLADVTERFKSTVIQVASASPSWTVSTLLPLIRSAGMKVSLHMTRNHDAYTTDGNFDLEKWQAQLQPWENSGVQEFIDDGTLVGHMLIDDIETFAGNNPTASELDEMARSGEEIMPGLLTFVRQMATKMPVPENDQQQYQYLDAVVNQYKASDGPVTDYAQNEYAQAQALGLEIINGLNICDGGDGSSGQIGWRADKFAMSAEEITTYGEVLLENPEQKMFLMWEYDGEEIWSDGATIGSDYFDQPDMQAALLGLGNLAAQN